MRALVGAAAVVLLTASCGSGPKAKPAALDGACKRERASLARVGPIGDLGDATRALRSVIALERRALADVEAAGTSRASLAARLRLSIGSAERSLRSIVSADPQQTMTPVRTGVPDARRAANAAAALVASLCSPA